MISLTEELILLAVEDDGRIAYTAGSPNFAMALVGACLVDLNQAGRVDADLNGVNILNTAPTGLEAQDRVLQLIAAGPVQTTEQWVLELQGEAPDLVRLTLAQLQKRGILHLAEKRFLWALRARRYPIDDGGKEQKEAKLRILAALLSDGLPTPDDSILIGLAVVGGLLEAFMSKSEVARLSERIAEIGGLDLVVRGVEAAIRTDAEIRAHAIMLSIH